jgi:hypothetical protein
MNLNYIHKDSKLETMKIQILNKEIKLSETLFIKLVINSFILPFEAIPTPVQTIIKTKIMKKKKKKKKRK